jgi:hypothetical protein
LYPRKVESKGREIIWERIYTGEGWNYQCVVLTMTPHAETHDYSMNLVAFLFPLLSAFVGGLRARNWRAFEGNNCRFMALASI